MLARVALIIVLIVVAGCGEEAARKDDEEARVLAAFYPVAFAAEEVAASGTRVENVTPPGTEPHDVELSARDVERIAEADLVLYVGGGFQPALENALARFPDVRAIDLLPLAHPIDGDPHVWLDPFRYSLVVERVGAALGRPSRAKGLVERLLALDREFRSGLRRCERRTIVTSHAAFAYLADRYDLRQVAIAGLAPEAEPTARELEDVVADVRGSGATTVFFEPLVSRKLAETVAREAGVATAVLDPLEGLSAEKLRAGEDYFSVMRKNLAALREALACR